MLKVFKSIFDTLADKPFCYSLFMLMPFCFDTSLNADLKNLKSKEKVLKFEEELSSPDIYHSRFTAGDSQHVAKLDTATKTHLSIQIKLSGG